MGRKKWDTEKFLYLGACLGWEGVFLYMYGDVKNCKKFDLVPGKQTFFQPRMLTNCKSQAIIKVSGIYHLTVKEGMSLKRFGLQF